jgi:hypothetical protein
MANATNRAKAGYVTISTVRSREEANRLIKQLEAAGIECALVEERLTVPPGSGRHPSGGIKVQVDRSDAKRAIELLREQHGPETARVKVLSGLRTKLWLPAEGWLRTALEVGVILAAATTLAMVFFLY